MNKRTNEITDITKRLIKNAEHSSHIDTFQAEYLKYMLNKTKEFTDELKINRWLGFIQGVLVTESSISIEKLIEECSQKHEPR